MNSLRSKACAFCGRGMQKLNQQVQRGAPVAWPGPADGDTYYQILAIDSVFGLLRVRVRARLQTCRKMPKPLCAFRHPRPAAKAGSFCGSYSTAKAMP